DGLQITLQQGEHGVQLNPQAGLLAEHPLCGGDILTDARLTGSDGRNAYRGDGHGPAPPPKDGPKRAGTDRPSGGSGFRVIRTDGVLILRRDGSKSGSPGRLGSSAHEGERLEAQGTFDRMSSPAAGAAAGRSLVLCLLRRAVAWRTYPFRHGAV